MNWSDERYVRLYTRDTPDWQCLSFLAQGLFCLLLRKVDRAGVLPLGRAGRKAVAIAIGHAHQWPLLEPALDELLTDGCLQIVGDNLVVPNYLDAQEAEASDRARAKKHREVRRDKARVGLVTQPAQSTDCVTGASRNVTEEPQGVTEASRGPGGDATPRDGGVTNRDQTVTPSRAVPPKPFLPSQQQQEAAAARNEGGTRSGPKAATTKPESAEALPLAPGEPSGAPRGHATEGTAAAVPSGTLSPGIAEPARGQLRPGDLIPTPAAVGHSAEAATFDDAPPRSCPVLDLVELGPLGAELRARLERRAEWKFLVATHARKAEVRAKLEEAVQALGVDAAEALCWSVMERRRRQGLNPWQPKAMAFFVELLEEAAKGGDPMPAEVPGVEVNQVHVAMATEAENRWAPLLAQMNPAQREAYELEKARLGAEIRGQGLWTTEEFRQLDQAEKFLFAKWSRKVGGQEASA